MTRSITGEVLNYGNGVAQVFIKQGEGLLPGQTIELGYPQSPEFEDIFVHYCQTGRELEFVVRDNLDDPTEPAIILGIEEPLYILVFAVDPEGGLFKREFARFGTFCQFVRHVATTPFNLKPPTVRIFPQIVRDIYAEVLRQMVLNYSKLGISKEDRQALERVGQKLLIPSDFGQTDLAESTVRSGSDSKDDGEPVKPGDELHQADQ